MSNEIVLPPTIDEAKLDALGARLFFVWPTYRDDRRVIEERWLRNLRQVRKIYDPEVLSLIPSDRSKAYPGITQWMVRGTIARLMQMLFPMTEKNYGIRPSPLPDLDTTQMQGLLDQLVASKGGDPAAVELTDDEIYKAISEFAKGKAEKMETKIEDDLQEMGYVNLVRQLVRSAVIYNIGILKGPLHRVVKVCSWEKDPYTGKYTAVERDGYKPFFEFLPVWSYYPDLTAVAIDKQDGNFERHIMAREQIEGLANRPDFLADRIIKYLNDHTSGNYQAQWWESVIKGEDKSAQAVVMGKESRKFEVLSYWGGVTGHELRGAGNQIKDEDLGRTFQANVWMIDNLVIKCRLAPLGSEIKHHHIFVFEDDDLSILGNGQCDVLRDSQMSICETARAALDNMSVIGPMVIVNDDLLTPGQSTSVSKHKTWHFENMAGNQPLSSAVANLSIDSHLSELTALLQLFMGFAEKESGLPPPSVGDMSGGGSEALRTSKNASMFLGAAALPIRDTVRNYDVFTVSAISALVAWNRKYAPDPSRDGDHNIIARGSTSLIAKEVMSGALNEFRAGITPDEMPHLKGRALLTMRMKVNDLPVDDLLEDEEKANKIIERNMQMQQQQIADQSKLIGAQVEEKLAHAFELAAKARAEDASLDVDVFKLFIEALKSGDKGAADRAKAMIDAHKADTARIAAEKPAAGGTK